ncbi:myosin light chain kinase family member 4 [Pyrrhoderma noxium]|uniref:Myosin light chain kinase family member 4 n=1 Tax=Pyrrhoderma noxium TaxID=2282107 RepID=A0A286UKX3_9AGAM|nr:myosin light chain kinase family member 4 [Pyrrhoderma noxium]
MYDRGHELIRQIYRPNEAIDPNHIVDHELGSGRSSNVYLCTNGYAIKILVRCTRQGPIDDKCPAKKVYTNEVEYFNKIRESPHKNLIRIHNIFETQQNIVCIQMPHLKGVTLAEKMDEYPKEVPECYAAFVAYNIYSGLDHLHTELDLVTTDLTPWNIMQERLCHDKDWISCNWVIIDFGLSGSIAGKPYDRSSSGTLEYSAPEKVLTMFTYAKSNVYVAGAIIYEVLVDFPLYYRDEGLKFPQLQDQELKRDFKDDRYAEKQIGFNLNEKSDLCRRHLRKCLQYEREQRPTASEAKYSEWISQFRVSDTEYDFSINPSRPTPRRRVQPAVTHTPGSRPSTTTTRRRRGNSITTTIKPAPPKKPSGPPRRTVASTPTASARDATARSSNKTRSATPQNGGLTASSPHTPSRRKRSLIFQKLSISRTKDGAS